MKYFLYYGLIGDWIISQIGTGSLIRVLMACGIIILDAIMFEILVIILRDVKEYFLCTIAICGYVLIYGLIVWSVSCVFCIIVLMAVKLCVLHKTEEPEPVEETNAERRELLWEELFYSNVVLCCLDEHHQQVYKSELDNLFNDESCTAEEAKEQIKKWDFYLDNPMEGGEKWKEQHLND